MHGAMCWALLCHYLPNIQSLSLIYWNLISCALASRWNLIQTCTSQDLRHFLWPFLHPCRFSFIQVKVIWRSSGESVGLLKATGRCFSLSSERLLQCWPVYDAKRIPGAFISPADSSLDLFERSADTFRVIYILRVQLSDTVKAFFSLKNSISDLCLQIKRCSKNKRRLEQPVSSQRISNTPFPVVTCCLFTLLKDFYGWAKHRTSFLLHSHLPSGNVQVCVTICHLSLTAVSQIVRIHCWLLFYS